MPRREPVPLSDAGSSEPSANAAPIPERGAEPIRMTDRQLEILVNVARGRTNREIGAVLGINERTVRNHMRAILRKLTSTDRTQAVVMAIERGWIPIPIQPEEPAVAVTPEPLPASGEVAG